MNHVQLYEKVFGERYVKEPYKFESHSFSKHVAGKQCCSKCGLLALNNDFTYWAIKMGCNNSDHPSYRKEWLKSGKRK